MHMYRWMDGWMDRWKMITTNNSRIVKANQENPYPFADALFFSIVLVFFLLSISRITYAQVTTIVDNYISRLSTYIKDA